MLRITSDPPRFIAAMQLGVTLTSLGIGALGEQALSKAFDNVMATLLAVILAYLLLTFVHVVIGELVPKGIALGHSEGTALVVAAPVRAFFTVFQPLVWALQRSTELVLRAFGLEPPGAEGEVHSEAELKMLVPASTEHGEIEQQEQEMLYKVFDFADKEANDVMVPRPEVVAISIDLPPEEALKVTLEAPYTRYPVYRETIDNVIGTLHVRDLFQALQQQGIESVDLDAMLRPPYVVPGDEGSRGAARGVPPHEPAHGRRRRRVRRHGGDRHARGSARGDRRRDRGRVRPAGRVEEVDDDTYRIDGMFPIDEFNERFGTSLPDEDYHTIGGFVFGQLGRAAGGRRRRLVRRSPLRRARGRGQPHRSHRGDLRSPPGARRRVAPDSLGDELE